MSTVLQKWMFPTRWSENSCFILYICCENIKYNNSDFLQNAFSYDDNLVLIILLLCYYLFAFMLSMFVTTFRSRTYNQPHRIYIYVKLINSRINDSSSFLTNRPFTRNRESAKFLRTSYLTDLVQTR